MKLPETLLKLTLPHGGSSRFLNCTNGTKLRNASQKFGFTISKAVADIWKKHCIRVALRVSKQFKTQDLGKLENIRKMQNLDEDRAKSPVFFSRNKIFVTTAKNFAVAVIKVFCSCPIMHAFFTLFQQFCSGLTVLVFIKLQCFDLFFKKMSMESLQLCLVVLFG